MVTGSASGMGKAMTELFAAEGASVVAADWNGERLNEVVAALTDARHRVTAMQSDISQEAVAAGLVDKAVEVYGRPDILVNNAGIMDYMAGVGDLTNDVWERVMGINLNGPMYTMRRAVQVMTEQESGGSIVNIGSTASLSGGAAGAAYTASKHALRGLTVNTAWQYAERGIRCNLIAPGGTVTNIAESMPQDKVNMLGAGRAMAFSGLMQRYGQPQDIANMALFLASDDTKMVNGALIPIDGGWMAL
ncbi:SDR family NAD(P)-dependent oxidoreductase [Deinococcus lacus]|uniref:SDR family NAD(P)-dependent oxidoreductase n=1 Tax=Deinococcus lacus TaxID=392561 RepID=A0ABW1YCI1_9DEIO